MGVLARAFAITTLLGLVACAAIAGLDPPPSDVDETSKPPDRTTPDPTSSSSTNPPPNQPQNADGSTPQDAATSTDAAGTKDADATTTTTPPPCTKTQNGGACSEGITCCSTSCNEAKVCAADCRGGGSSCDPFASAPCCNGFYCLTALCAPCIGPGGTPTDKITGGKNSKACCSRVIAANGTCQ